MGFHSKCYSLLKILFKRRHTSYEVIYTRYSYILKLSINNLLTQHKPSSNGDFDTRRVKGKGKTC